MELSDIVERYRERFLARHGNTLSADQWSAVNAITGCRTGQYGELLLSCRECQGNDTLYRSCGHRACNQCQQHQAQQWLSRQERKPLPVPYYLVTFTLPRELRSLARRHPNEVYGALLQCAASILRRFGLNQKGFHAELGLCAVLHTHTRWLDYHPHVHCVVPGGGIQRQRREWHSLKGNYLFNGRALAAAFRGEMLHTLATMGLTLPPTPKRWVVHCKRAGQGLKALQYLSRYLYRGVISDRNLLEDDGTQVTFRYKESKTGQCRTRQLPGEDFIALILQHVSPKGFRRTRDYGFLHGNAKRLLRIVQWVFRIPVPPVSRDTSQGYITCPRCHGMMQAVGIRALKIKPE